MKKEMKACAVLSGVFLLLSGPVTFDGISPGRLLLLAWAPMIVMTAVFLVLRRIRKAAITMSLAALSRLLMELPEIPKYFGPRGYAYNYDPASGYAEYVPTIYVLIPILGILALALFSLALWLRGWVPFGMMLAAGAAELAEMVLQFRAIGYISGHPSPFNLIPINFAISAVFAGLYLLSRKHKAPEDA